MRARVLAVLGVVVACNGTSSSTPADAPGTPRVDAALVDALACGALTDCDGSCVDLGSDATSCGACGLACGPSEACIAGHCTDEVDSCPALFAINGSAAANFYTTSAEAQMWCDPAMPSVTTFGLYFGDYDADHGSAYEFVTPTQLQNASYQLAFVKWFASQNGIDLIDKQPWAASSCCFKYTGTADGTYLGLRGATVDPIDPNTDMLDCGGSGNKLADDFEVIEAPLMVTTPSIDTSFFTTNPASSITSCFDDENPAMFWRTSP